MSEKPAYRLAIVGSRDYPKPEIVREFVATLPEHVIVVSGGARGVDREAENAARRHGLHVDIFRADWKRLGKRAGPLRNERMIPTCQGVVAFYDGKSRGTAHAVSIARQNHLQLRVIGADGQRLDPRTIRSTGGIISEIRDLTKASKPPGPTDPAYRNTRFRLGPTSKGRGSSRRRARATKR